MDPIDSWVDAAEVRRLAESLMASAPEPMETPRLAYGEAFVGFERAVVEPGAAAGPAPGAVPEQPARVEQNARTALAGARQLAERGGILGARPLESPAPAPQQAPVAVAPAPQPAPAPAAVQTRAVAATVQAEPLHTPEGLFMDRLRAYGHWLHRSIAAKAFFVADREGELLIDEINSPKLLQVARTLAQASWAANRQAGSGPAVGSLHVKLGAESVLEVLPVMSRYGPLILGIIVPSLLPAATVQVVGSSLERVVDGPLQRS
jgi:hypothetical protein